MKLGHKLPEPGSVSAMPVGPAKAKMHYPSFSIRDADFVKFTGKHPHKVGQEGTATIKYRCSGHSDQEYGKSIDFEVHEMDPHGGDSGASELEEMDAADKKKYMPK